MITWSYLIQILSPTPMPCAGPSAEGGRILVSRRHRRPYFSPIQFARMLMRGASWSIVEHPAQIRQAYLEHRTSACFMPLSLISMSSLRFWRLLKGRFGQCVVGEESQQRGRTHQPCCKHTFMMHGLLLRHVMTVIGWVSSIMIHQSLLS